MQRMIVNQNVTIGGQVVDKTMDNSNTIRSEIVTELSSYNLNRANALLPNASIPNWVPDAVQRYLTHTQAGLPIREVARRSGCHASTVLRQIRKIEVRRDDPLIDRALHSLSSKFFHGTPSYCAKEASQMGQHPSNTSLISETANIDQQATRILRRLGESGAVLAVAEGMETAVVVRETQGGGTSKTASISADFVAVLALNAWVDCLDPGRISRYKITQAGRNKLLELSGANVETGAKANEAGATYGEKIIQEDGRRRRVRYYMSESPVAALSRLKDKDGTAFLSEDLVDAAERLREDFEVSQMGPKVAQNWDHFLTAGTKGSAPSGNTSTAPSDARERVGRALRYLGAGLGDVALHCCCHLEGLESAEKRMGWSARSGKIVLRIALQRLNQFYKTEMGDVLIG